MTTVVVCGEPLQEIRAGMNSNDIRNIIVSGDVTNILIGAQRLLPILADAIGSKKEVTTKLLTALGNDTRGKAFVDFYKKAGVQTDLITLLPDRKTAAYGLAYSDVGHEAKFVYKYWDREDAAVRYLFEGQCRENIRRFVTQSDKNTFFVTTGIAISRPLNNSAFDRLLEAIDGATEKGANIVFNTDLRINLFGQDAALARHRILALWMRADIVFCSYPDDVAAFPALDTREKTANSILEHGGYAAIISEGRLGLTLYKNDGSRLRVPAMEVTDARGIVDTAGGGTALVASTVAGLALDLMLEDAARVSVLLARNVMSIPGGVPPQESMPTKNEVRRILSAEH
jgi:2-dehydro-3-deoxygluconokinase